MSVRRNTLRAQPRTAKRPRLSLSNVPKGGGPFVVICPVLKPAFRLTRGNLSYFMSSGVGRRGFCSECGTPLTFDYPDGDDIGVLVGTLDEPSRAPPENQYGNESRVSWYPILTNVPGDHPTYADDPEMRLRISSTNRQHPDHDTYIWPPAEV
uniref:GFA family protein n=1 Tax=Rhizobium ruizarguesonis TaxID=2081791 RepID=UPI001FE03DE5|nr:GFA family protein [Rhizobium ruizarguesonis]